jgi:hypothetical protein
MSSNDVNVFCHICGSQQTARMNDQLGELQCNACMNTFVEEVNQGVEEFLTTTNDHNLSVPSTDSTVGSVDSHHQLDRESPVIDPNQIVQQILGRVLGISGGGGGGGIGMGQDDNEPGIAIIHSSNGGGNGRRPVGLLIRHAVINNNDNNNNTANNNNDGLPRGLFGLLSSLNNMRLLNNNNPDALSNAQFEQFLHHLLMNENAHSGVAPASESVLSSLTKQTVTDTTNISSLGDCCISQEPFEVGDVVVLLPCGHNYKEEPIVHWLKMHNTCPVCRIELNPTNNNNNNNNSSSNNNNNNNNNAMTSNESSLDKMD